MMGPSSSSAGGIAAKAAAALSHGVGRKTDCVWRHRGGRLLTVLLLAATMLATACATGPGQPPASAARTAREIAPDVFLIPGDVPEERGPDGNTVIFRGRDGLVVVDTGRHVQHSDAILAFAAADHRPIVAIVNTHWHLDHSSGNRRLLGVFPQAPVYTSRAVDRALADGGFLARGVAPAQERLARADLSTLQRDETNLFLATMAAADALRPTAALERSQPLRVAGKALDAHVVEHAVTDADVWLYDPATRLAVVGDLVTLPAPFLDTACPRAWREALDVVAATPFVTLVPGHGEPMSRAQFDTYRTAFGAYLACAAGDRGSADCAAEWAAGIADLQPNDARLHAGAAPYAKAYAEFLRKNGGKSPGCQAP